MYAPLIFTGNQGFIGFQGRVQRRIELVQSLADFFFFFCAPRQHVLQAAHPETQPQLADLARRAKRRQPDLGDFLRMPTHGTDLEAEKYQRKQQYTATRHKVHQQFVAQC